MSISVFVSGCFFVPVSMFVLFFGCMCAPFAALSTVVCGQLCMCMRGFVSICVYACVFVPVVTF